MNEPFFILITLENIFFYLPNDDIFNCKFVCRFWYHTVPLNRSRSTKKFEWYQTDEIFASKNQLFQKSEFFEMRENFCSTLGCHFKLYHSENMFDKSKKLVFQSLNHSFGISINSKVENLYYVKVPTYLSIDKKIHHYIILKSNTIVDFTDLNDIHIIDSCKKLSREIHNQDVLFCDIFAGFSSIYSPQLRNQLFLLPKMNVDLLMKPFPKFENPLLQNLFWYKSKNDVIFASASKFAKVGFVIFKNLDVMASGVFSIDHVDLEFNFINNSYIFCNKYLMILARPGICICDCLSRNPETPLIVIQESTIFYFAGYATLTDTHFMCVLGSSDPFGYCFCYFIFNMITKEYKKFKNNFGNFLSNYRIEQISDDVVLIHSFPMGAFRVDLNSLTLESHIVCGKSN